MAPQGDSHAVCGIPGVAVRPLVSHADPRGALTELFRTDWDVCGPPAQWNLVRSQANAMRGVHLHAGHADYLVVIDGEMLVGLHDARAGSPACGEGAMARLSCEALSAIHIPSGVAHGFYSARPCTYLYGLSACWSMADEFGCRWDARELGLDWPQCQPLLSERDRLAGSYSQMIAGFESARAVGVQP